MQKKRGSVKKSGNRRVVFGNKEKRRLVQLGFCICLFLIIFVSRGNELFQEKQAGERLLKMVQENTDFTSAFSSFGESVSQGEPVWAGVEKLLTDLFGVEKEVEFMPVQTEIVEGPAYWNALRWMRVPATKDSMIRFHGSKSGDLQTLEDWTVEDTKIDTPSQIEETPSVNTAPEEETLEMPMYSGPDLPANATMEYIELGLNATKTPVFGEISSGYGYRDHPITEAHSFHAGVDIAADTGTPIVAFSDGMVEFIGESRAYGLYIQLDHGNGIKSFYCHCSELLFGKGTSVEAGQTIALVGDTGDATGSHLHLELKKEGILLNPAYYIESIS